MRFRGKLFTEITDNDVSTLKDNRVPESLELEYKRDLPDNGDSAKKEFLADISAFANTGGGVIIFGIEEERDSNNRSTGIPSDIVGLDSLNFDETKLRLEAIVRDGLDPKISNLQFATIEVNGNSVLIVGIPRSLFSPHMIWYQRSGKFYMRTNSGKIQMDVTDTRRAFLLADEWEKEADNFRKERIMSVESSKFLPVVQPEIFTFIHICPLGRLKSITDLRVHETQLTNLAVNMIERMGRSSTSRYNLDGYLVMESSSTCEWFVQFFSNGSMEVFCDITRRNEDEISFKYIDYSKLELLAVNACKFYYHFSNTISIDPPFIVFLSVTNAKGKSLLYRPLVSHWRGSEQDYIIDRNDLVLPGVIVDDMKSQLRQRLVPALDLILSAGNRPEHPAPSVRSALFDSLEST